MTLQVPIPNDDDINNSINVGCIDKMHLEFIVQIEIA